MIQVKTKEELRELVEKTIKEKGNDCDLNFIDTSLVTDMSFIFDGHRFNGDISEWNVSNVENMSYMFYMSRFNGDISRWNTSNVIDMHGMFEDSEFNGDISCWNTNNVKFMFSMFYYSSFKGDISNWNVSNVIDFGDFGLYNDSHLPLKFRNLDKNKEYIGWKKLQDNKICKLKIQLETIKVRGCNKCRCSGAEVLEITDINNSIKYSIGYSINDNNFKYEVGKTVKPKKKFNLDRWNECSSGIHFFLTREEAINYNNY